MKRLMQLGMAIVVCCYLSGCDGSNGNSGGGRDSPEAVAKAFAEIWDSGLAELDVKASFSKSDSVNGKDLTALREKVKNYVVSSYREFGDNFHYALNLFAVFGLPKKNKEDSYQILDCKTSGNKAVVQYTRKNQTNVVCVIVLMKIDGKWKVTDSGQTNKSLNSFLE